MGFFNSGLFWFIEGILACLAVRGIKIWAEDRGLILRWWKWLYVVAWFTLAGFTLAFIGTSLGEHEPIAALRGGILFGIITIILGVGGWRWLTLSKRKD